MGGAEVGAADDQAAGAGAIPPAGLITWLTAAATESVYGLERYVT